MTDTNEDEKDTYRVEVPPLEVELVTREAGADGTGEVLARFTVPVLLCRDDAEDPGWKVDEQGMKDELLSQLRAWALAATRSRGERVEQVHP